MKKFYNTPEFEITELLTEDILSASNDDDQDWDNEVGMDIGKLF